MTLIYALSLQSRDRLAQELATETLPSMGRGNNQMMNEPPPSIVTTEDSSDYPAILTGDIAEARISEKETLDRFSLVSFAQADALT